MSVNQAKSSNEAVNGLPNGVAVRSKETIILRRRNSQPLSSRVEYLKSRQIPPYSREIRVRPDSLQNFTQNEIG